MAKEEKKKQKIHGKLSCTQRQIIKFVEMKGFRYERQKSTDHKIFKNDAGKSIPIPIKKKDMREGTVSGILREIHSDNYELAEFIANKCKPKKNDDSDIA